MIVTVFIPFHGVRIIDPRTHRMVPQDGVIVSMGGDPVDQFWARRVADQDGELVDREDAEPATAKASKKKASDAE